MPLLNAALAGSVSVPATARRRLESHCRTVIAHNLALASELAELLELFEQSGVSAVPFKGPAWTQALYGDLARRQIRDLDIFGILPRPREQAIYLPHGVMFAPKDPRLSR